METLKALIVVVMLVAGQTLWKLGVEDLGGVKLNLESLAKAMLNPLIVTGIILYFLATLLWLSVISNKELSSIFPIMALSYVLILVPAYYFLHEPITALKVGASLLIVAGVVLLIR